MSDSTRRFSLLNIDVASIAKQPAMIFAIFLILIVLMLIIPIPAFMLDFLMAANIIVSLLVILNVAYLKRAIEFSVFPSVLLTATLFRLSVNVSSTRLILSQGINFKGKMIRAFGSFVVGSPELSGMVIGLIIFTIITIVQFIVITRGATRVSEVAARFSLDSMPNKYMAIDMDVQNGVIDESEGIKRRQELQEESSFYGNMDGASKFVQGDVIVGIIVTLINMIGGFAIGMAVRGEGFEDALANYIPLAIGDGLVNQIPSLLISTATGLIVTRSQTKDSLGTVVWDQLKVQYKIFFIAAGFLFAMAFLPGFPHIILLILSGGMGFAGYALYQSGKKASEAIKEGKKGEKEEAKGPENVTSLLKVDPLTLYIGYELIPLVDKSKNAELLDAITGIRRNLAIELGIIVPPIRIQDNMRLQANQYSFKLRGQEIAKGSIKIGYLMAMGEGIEDIPGEKTIEPAFGMSALWISNEMREKAENLGYTVVDPPTIISTHIQEILKAHADEILGREELNKIIDNAKKDYPNVVEDTLAEYKRSVLQKILQELLKEGVSIRDIVTIFETLSEHSPQTPVYELVEFIRQALRRSITAKYTDDENKLYVLRFHPSIENEVYKNMSTGDDGMPLLTLKPDYIHNLQNAIKDKVKEMVAKGYPPVIVCQPPVRKAFWELSRHVNRNISVLSTRELVSGIEVVLFGQIAFDDKVLSK
jgi:flagellar biosynthesis protein FlhA